MNHDDRPGSRWYETPIEDLPAEYYLARAARFHGVAEQLDPAMSVRFEAMAVDALEIAERKMLDHGSVLA
jgi:predicted lipid carrier protein YhbT